MNSYFIPFTILMLAITACDKSTQPDDRGVDYVFRDSTMGGVAEMVDGGAYAVHLERGGGLVPVGTPFVTAVDLRVDRARGVRSVERSYQYGSDAAFEGDCRREFAPDGLAALEDLLLRARLLRTSERPPADSGFATLELSAGRRSLEYQILATDADPLILSTGGDRMALLFEASDCRTIANRPGAGQTAGAL